MTRFDAVQYIAHGIAKRPGMSEPRPVRGAGRRHERGRGEKSRRRAYGLLHQPQQEGARRQDRSFDRPRTRGSAYDPGAVPPPKEQSAVRRRSRRRQDRDRRGARAQDRQWRRAGRAQRSDDIRARHGRAASGHALPRRFRRASQGRDEGDREPIDGGVLFIDEIHTVIGAGATSGGAMDASNFLSLRFSRAFCAASARRRTRNTGSTSRRTGRWCAGSRRSTSRNRRSKTRSRSCEASEARSRAITSSNIRTRRSRRRSSCPPSISTTANCRTRRST